MIKHIFLIAFTVVYSVGVINAQDTELTGKWQLKKVEADNKIYDDLKAVYIFEKGGVLKSAYSPESESFEVGSWDFNKKLNSIIMSSSMDKDFNGKASIINHTKNELTYKKDGATLFFKRLSASDFSTNISPSRNTNTIGRLSFTEADFFNEDGDFIYEADVDKLPWQDPTEMVMSLVNVKQLVYKFSTLVDDSGVFEHKTLTSDVNANAAEQTLSIDFIFYGYDRYNLPEDTDLPPNTEYDGLLYPEEENTFRIAGTEEITTPAGTFDCTVVEAIGHSDACKKLWMIKDKPGVYAKIIEDKPGMFGHYFIYELAVIK